MVIKCFLRPLGEYLTKAMEISRIIPEKCGWDVEKAEQAGRLKGSLHTKCGRLPRNADTLRRSSR
jgi:hypothetical protein